MGVLQNGGTKGPEETEGIQVIMGSLFGAIGDYFEKYTYTLQTP